MFDFSRPTHPPLTQRAPSPSTETVYYISFYSVNSTQQQELYLERLAAAESEGAEPLQYTLAA